MKTEILNIEKLTDSKYLNLYRCDYLINDTKNLDYYVASRREKNELAVNYPNIVNANVVRIVPYYYKDNEMYVVLTKEFRYPLNCYVYSTPAGIIEKDESPDNAIVREIYEEIGGKVINSTLLADASYTSVGLTDEAIVCYMAEIELTNTQHLDGSEQIEYFVMPFKDIKRFADEKVTDFQAKMLINYFYYYVLNNKI